jgi:t-SNARE complex subunit (syntaxin)
MKQQILDALKAKYEGVSDAILGRIAEKLAKTATTAEDVETAVAGVTFQQVLESYGDSRATEAQQSAVSNYEKKHNLKDGKPIEKQEPPKQTPPTGGEDVPAWAKELIESNKKAYEEINRLKAERTTETRQAQLSKLTEKLPEPIRKAYGRISVDNMTDEDFTALLNDVNGETEAISQTLNTPRGGSGRPIVAAGAGDKLTKAQEAAIAHREGAPTPDGQPF